MQLRFKNFNDWNGFHLPVAKLVTCSDIAVLHHPAKSINDKNQESAYIETKLYDKLLEMKQEYDLLCGAHGCRRLPPIVEVAQACDEKILKKTR